MNGVLVVIGIVIGIPLMLVEVKYTDAILENVTVAIGLRWFIFVAIHWDCASHY